MINKTRLKKYLDCIGKTKRKVYLVKDLSLDSNIKEEIIIEDLIQFEPMLNFDLSFNLKNLKEVLEKEYQELLETSKPKKRDMKNNEYKNYQSFIDYVYQVMCVHGGLLDLGYNLTAKDIKILTKLLKLEREKLKK